ncbi:hypothetical protein GCM10022220_41690 [Actinocatenispora rupis]|uniref:TM2 domain-containing protein n=1 Tax=Actinocatenispora rupis TaxID=519421 RepID=A0A8J3NBI8_9ACTN|nr:hypothetical protein Aru02nite_42880 [Actinocatenispora rupis]
MASFENTGPDGSPVHENLPGRAPDGLPANLPSVPPAGTQDLAPQRDRPVDPVAPGDMTRDHQVPQSDAAAQQPAPQPVPPVQVVVSQNVSQQAVVAMGGVLRRSWVAALVLAILVGWLGVDSFYLGQTGKGVLKLFTFGLFGILWLIDTIMIATKSVRGVEWV